MNEGYSFNTQYYKLLLERLKTKIAVEVVADSRNVRAGGKLRSTEEVSNRLKLTLLQGMR